MKNTIQIFCLPSMPLNAIFLANIKVLPISPENLSSPQREKYREKLCSENSVFCGFLYKRFFILQTPAI
jgi:hypothetical protein